MINNNLQFCREELGLKQSEIGEFLSVKKSTVSGWENGYSIIPFEKLIKFCNMYDLSLDYVCGLSRKNILYSKIPTDKKIIGQKLKDLRIKLGLTQQQIADECDIARTTFNGYESGRYYISTLAIYTICKKYNLSMDSILRK